MKFGTRAWCERVMEIGRAHVALVCDTAVVFERHPQRKECFGESGIRFTSLGAAGLTGELCKTLLEAAPAPKLWTRIRVVSLSFLARYLVA